MDQRLDLSVNGQEFRSPNVDLAIALAAGLFNNGSIVNKFGRNTDVDIGTEDIIGIGGTLEEFSAAATVDIVSSDSTDNQAGVGARSVTLYGLDANYALQEVTKLLHATDGTNAVTTTETWLFIHHVEVATAGSGLANAGVLTISITSGNDVLNIAIGANETKQAAYMIPANYTGLLVYQKFVAQDNPSATVITCERFQKPLGGVYLQKYVVDIADNNVDEKDYSRAPVAIDEKTIIKLTATSDVVNQVVNGFFDILLIPKITTS